jgi:hypothetical protein
MSSGTRTVQIELSADEALVLFELTHRFEDEQYVGLTFVDPAERIALGNLTASLESVAEGVFSADYDNLLASARERLAAQT